MTQLLQKPQRAQSRLAPGVGSSSVDMFEVATVVQEIMRQQSGALSEEEEEK